MEAEAPPTRCRLPDSAARADLVQLFVDANEDPDAYRAGEGRAGTGSLACSWSWLSIGTSSDGIRKW